MTDTADLQTPAALAGIEPLATSVAHTADGTFTTRIFPGVAADMITIVTNLDGDGHGEPYGTTLEPGSTPEDEAAYQAAMWINARGAADAPRS